MDVDFISMLNDFKNFLSEIQNEIYFSTFCLQAKCFLFLTTLYISM